jgi:hypothetical protein
MYSFKKSLIALVGLLALVAVLAALLPLVSQGQADSNNPLTRDPRRSFYLTQTKHDGSQALTACAAGYHMASLWEILDPSNLHYDTQLGQTTEDSGFGPPTESGVSFAGRGWIRTGVNATGSLEAGVANCETWTSASNTGRGTRVSLRDSWDSTIVTVISPWHAGTEQCSFPLSVWCVQD